MIARIEAVVRLAEPLPNGRLGQGLKVKYAHVAEWSVPGTSVQEGDVILRLAAPSQDVGQWLRRCRWWRMPRREYAAFKDAVRAGVLGEDPALLPGYLSSLGTRGRDETSPLVVARPWGPSPVSHSIAATSDDAALFELLAQAGGRLPA